MSSPERPDSSRADELLVIRCQLGERAAFDDLVARWAEPVHRHALRVCGDAQAAEELSQEIWLRVLQSFGRLRDAARFRAWLFGIAHRVLADRLRLRYATPVQEDVEFDHLPDVGASDRCERETAAREVERGLSALPAVEREVLTLFYLDEMPVTEVAQVLGLPAGTVKSRLFRARSLLRQSLQSQEYPS